jgi:geranylgeranyl diphosphate synthase type II
MSISVITEKPIDLIAAQTMINDFLLQYAQQERKRAADLHPLYTRLWESIEQQIGAGGKRLRPYLVMLSYEAFGGTDKAAILEIAGAWELLHVSMLMHDDIIDRDYMRHGVPNVAGQYLEHYAHIPDEASRRHYADSAALLAGDLVLTAAYKCVENSRFPTKDLHAALTLFHEAVFDVIGGELLDTEATITDVTIEPQLIAEAKTASYSLIGPLLTGATLAGAPKPTLMKLRKLGSVLGIGYQLVDDLLGIFGDQMQTGKPANSDLAEAKRSSVVVMSLALMSESDRAQAERWLMTDSARHVMELRALIKATPVKTRVREQLDAYKEIALTIISELNLKRDYQQIFQDMVDTLLSRDA